MECHIHIGGKQLTVVDLEPRCGEDFCEECGECLACNGGDECYPAGEHQWIEYFSNEQEATDFLWKFSDSGRLRKAGQEFGQAVLKEFEPILKPTTEWLTRALKRIGMGG